MAGLLFLALAYLAVGQAGANRGDAQAAADAAALAAAQETRDQLAGDWVDNVLDPTKWEDIFEGVGSDNTCWRAYQLAEANDASATCEPGLMRYTVEAETNKSVGDSVVPGTEEYRSTARATAVIEALCTFDPLPSPTPSTLPEPEPEPSPSDGGGGEEPPPVEPPRLDCDGVTWSLDPQDLRLPEPQDLFDVHLVD